MIKIKLEPNEVELALNIASKRYIGNLRMGKTFSYGYTKGIKSQLTDGVLGALGEVAYAKATNSFYNGSYSDDNQFYSDSDFQNNIEIRCQEKKVNNFLIIRPGEKKGKYILVIKDNDKDFNFTIMGSFIYNDDLPPEKLTDFGYTQRPPAYKIELKELNPRLE
jgi:hypothetical protein